MKTVYLIRHGEAEWNNLDGNDINRALTTLGHENAVALGKQLTKSKIFFDAVISSSAIRTKETALAIFGQSDFIIENILFKDELYLASYETMLSVIEGADQQNSTIAIIGHNPGISALSNYLTTDNIDAMATCGIVKVELEIDAWNEIVKGIGIKKHYHYPSQII